RRRRDPRDRSPAAARRRARNRGARHLLVIAAAERAPAPRDPGVRNGRRASALPAAVRSPNIGWTADGGPARAGRALRRRAAGGRICRRRDHWVRGRAQRCARPCHGGPERRTARRGIGWTAPGPPPRARAAQRYRKNRSLSRQLQALIPPGHRPPHSRWLAIFAPSASDWNFAHTMLGCTSFEPAKVAKPQSAPAMTFSRPTTLA